MPVIGEDGNPVSAFAAIASISEADRKDYYYAMLLQMEAFENSMRGLRYDRRYGTSSRPSAYRFLTFLKMDETKSFLNKLIDSDRADAGAENAEYVKMRKEAYSYHLSLREAASELNYQENQVRKLISLKKIMDDASGVKGKEEKYKVAKQMYEEEERSYKSRYLPKQEDAKRLEHIHLPELEVELASVLAAKKHCNNLIDQMPGALIDRSLSDKAGDVPLQDVKDRIARNMQRVGEMGLKGAAAERNARLKPMLDALHRVQDGKIAELTAQAAEHKNAPGNWYVREKGPVAAGDIKTTLDNLYNQSDARRTSNTRWYTGMVTEGKKLKNLLEGKDEHGVPVRNVTAEMLKEQARAAKAAAQRYLDEKADQFRPFPSPMRTRRLNEARALLEKARRLEEGFTNAKLGTLIDMDLQEKCGAERLVTAKAANKARQNDDEKKVAKVQGKIREGIVAEISGNAADDPLLDEPLNINAERNRNDILNNLSKTGKEGKSIDQITEELVADRITVTRQQMKDGAKKAGVNVTSYQEMMDRELERNRIQNPADLDEKRSKKTNQYIEEFRQTLRRCGISLNDYADMTENVSSRHEEDVREGLKQLSEMAETAQAHGVSREAFIRDAVSSSKFFWEEDINDVHNIAKTAGMIKLSTADLENEETIEAAMGRWNAQVKKQQPAQNHM